MNSAVDRRVVRTKAEIRQALVELIEEKGFEALSVKDITEKANINRGTFYLHYKDKYDLLDQTLNDVIRDIVRILLEQLPTLPKLDKGNTQILKAIVTKAFRYIDANAPLIKAILVTKGSYALQNEIKKVMLRNLFEKNEVPFIKKDKFQVPVEYFVAYISSAHLGVMQEWLERGRKETPEQMAEILINLTFRGPLFAAGILS